MKHRCYWYLDALHSVAAFAVVVRHWFSGHQVGYFGGTMLAVDLFFMLSGFVIQLTYRRRGETGWEVRTFLIKHVMRLYPLIAVSVLVGVVRFLGRSVFEPEFSWVAR